MGGLVCQWVRSGQMTKNLIIIDLIETIHFCLKIYDLYRHPHPWVDVWVFEWVSGGWMGQWVESVQITENLINLDLIKII